VAREIQDQHMRAYAGCIVTLAEQDTGEVRVIHRAGFSTQRGSTNSQNRTRVFYGILDALRDLCAEVDEWPGEWKVRTISTPQTIYADLQVRQEGNDGASPTPPEITLLTKIDRADLWEGNHRHPERARQRAIARKRKTAA
jgi:hypothetical protein